MKDLIDQLRALSGKTTEGRLFRDKDGDVCINDGREFNLVFCPAYGDGDDFGRELNPEVIDAIIERFSLAPSIAKRLLAAEELRRDHEQSRDEIAELAEFILKRTDDQLTKEDAKGIFADLQRARLRMDKALADYRAAGEGEK